MAEAARAPSVDEQRELLQVLEALDYQKRFRRFEDYTPYPKQMRFFELGGTKRERMLTAGNQQGKTHAGAFETSVHATGEYPEWWPGRRWDRPVKIWVCGKSSLDVRNTQQTKLCGEPGVESAFGTGLIPKDAFVDKPSLSRGVTDAYDTVQVAHKAGGVSIIRFKSYEQGREAFQAESVDIIWDDEEPPFDVYTEQLARLTATGGLVFVTYTSMKGPTTLTMRFRQEEHPDRGLVQMGLKDALHIPESEYQRLIESYPEYERTARIHGGVMQGEGRVFTYPEEQLHEATIEHVPPHWYKLWGLDFGIGHPFAAVLIAWDRDTDVIHLLHCIRMRDGLPINHWAAMKHMGAEVPVAWPKDGANRDPGSGVALASLYKKEGARMLADFATWPDGGNSTMAGIEEMRGRMSTSRLFVPKHLSDWYDEYRNYHVKDGFIVKLNDDLMSATRVAIMAKRFARPVGLGGHAAVRAASGTQAADVDFDVFAGA